MPVEVIPRVMNLAQTVEGNFRGSPRLCISSLLLAFEDEKSLRAYYASLGDGAVTVDSIHQCTVCGGLHATTHLREISGATSDTGTRQLTRQLPPHVEAHNAEMSARDRRQFQDAKKRP